MKFNNMKGLELSSRKQEHEKIQAEIQSLIKLQYCMFFLWCELRGKGPWCGGGSTQVHSNTLEHFPWG